MTKKRLYWFIQIFGWSAYAVFYIAGGTLMAPDDEPINPIVFSTIVFEAAVFLGITHFYRHVIITQGWLIMPFSKSIPRILLTITLLALPIYPLKVAFSFAIGLGNPDLWGEMLWTTPSNIFFLFLWTVFYFMFHYFERYNQSLKYEAAMREIELAHLKSQLNPHFIFNALNSIRALVDEDPKKSKSAITQLSNILRSSLVGDRKGLTKFDDEFRTVKDYLDLEATRYEERLKTEFDIHPDSHEFLVPPLMLQTLVENGVKHGISTLKKGGVIKLRTFVEDGIMHIQIRNSGQFANGTPTDAGFGIKNTKQRLKLIYGDKAQFHIFNETPTTVLTVVQIPQTESYESVNN